MKHILLSLLCTKNLEAFDYPSFGANPVWDPCSTCVGNRFLLRTLFNYEKAIQVLAMVKAKIRPSLDRHPIEKTQQGVFRTKEMLAKPFVSSEESREEFNLSFQTQRSTIRGRCNSSVPQWDARAAPPVSLDVGANPNSEQVSHTNQANNHIAYQFETSSQWDECTAQSGSNRQRRNGKSQNIWSSENQSFPKDCDSSLYSASTHHSMCALSLNGMETKPQRNHWGQQHPYHGNIREISDSMNRLHLRGVNDDNKTLAASVSSATTYSNNTIPGVVGVSSGSTAGTGGSSFTRQIYPPNYSTYHYQQSMMNSSAPVFYPNHCVVEQDRAPPGFSTENQHDSTVTSSSNVFEGEKITYQKDGISTKNSIADTGIQYQDNHQLKNSTNHYTNQEWQNDTHEHGDNIGPSNGTKSNAQRKNHFKQLHQQAETECEDAYASVDETSNLNSDAIRMIVNPHDKDLTSCGGSLTSSNTSALAANRLQLDRLAGDSSHNSTREGNTPLIMSGRAILPSMKDIEVKTAHDKEDENSFEDDEEGSYFAGAESSLDDTTTNSKKRDWLFRMNRRLTEVSVGELDPSTTPISAIMNAWAKTKSAHGASMVEKWLDRAQEEFDAGNTRIIPTNKMFTMAVDAWAKSGEGVSAAQRAETILQHMNKKFQTTGLENLRPTTGIFNAVINAWARSKEKIAPSRAEQILKWMDNLHKTNPSIKPDKYTFNTGEYLECFLI